jgi:hypothetical protein
VLCFLLLVGLLARFQCLDDLVQFFRGAPEVGSYPQFVIDSSKSSAYVHGLVGDAGTRRRAFLVAPPFQFGVLTPGLEDPAMFLLPAYDPAAIAIAGLGILAAAALAFGF